jgi:hypothetical protein
VIDYHLHLWPHEESSVWFHWTRSPTTATRPPHGVTELALTEHTSRFVDVVSAVGPFWLKYGHEPTSPVLGEYLNWHARNSLEEYVNLAQLAKDEGCRSRSAWRSTTTPTRWTSCRRSSRSTPSTC